MKKIAFIVLLLSLTACQAPYTRTIYQATGPRVCTEYRNSFRCSALQQVWNETIYPKNEYQMGVAESIYLPYRPQQSLSRAVYGTM